MAGDGCLGRLPRRAARAAGARVLGRPGLGQHDRRDIGELAERYQLREVAFDRWNATQLTTQLAGDGLALVGFGQGFASMAGPSRELLATRARAIRRRARVPATGNLAGAFFRVAREAPPCSCW